jgi:hypothetical protein
MQSPLDELLRTPVPNKLWHYTSIQAFQKIVETKAIWATDLKYLNDREEFKHTRKLTDEIASAAPDLDAEGFQNKALLLTAVNLLFDHGALPLSQVFVASFSAAEDQLGQWRGYSHGSSGVSLGFELSSFRPPPTIDTAVSFAPCVYDADHKNALVMHALHHFKDEVGGYRKRIYDVAVKLNPELAALPDKEKVMKDYLDAHPNEKEPKAKFLSAVIKGGYEFLRVGSLLKHRSFKEEEEWRLVLPILIDPDVPKNNPPRYRAGRSSLVPYIAHPFSALTPLPLVDVILGPGSDEDSVFAAERFLASQGLRVRPRLSTVPYRAL